MSAPPITENGNKALFPEDKTKSRGTVKIVSGAKTSDFNVTDHINVKLSGNDKVSEIALKNKDAIATIVLADSINVGDTANAKEWDINGENVKIAVERV